MEHSKQTGQVAEQKTAVQEELLHLMSQAKTTAMQERERMTQILDGVAEDLNQEIRRSLKTAETRFQVRSVYY